MRTRRSTSTREVLRNVFAFWKRPVGVATRFEDRGVIGRFDGNDDEEQEYETL